MASYTTDFYLDLSTCNYSEKQKNSLFFLLLYFQSGFSQDEMFEYFNCGIDYLIIIDHTKSSIENILQQLTQTHTTCFLLGTFISTSKYLKKKTNQFEFILIIFIFVDSSPTRNKSIRVPQQSRPRTVQLKNILFKYPKPSLTSNNTPIVVKDRMKQPIANDKTRCAVLISTNGKNKIPT
jgi:hypothetical protein